MKYKQDNTKRNRNLSLNVRLSRNERELIDRLSEKLGATKIDTIITALKHYENS